MVKDGSLYTGEGKDYTLWEKVRSGDWAQLIKREKHEGISRMKIYPIELVDREKGVAHLIDDNRKKRGVKLFRLKYITIQQREYVKARAMNNEKSVKRKKELP